ncbi:MAG TPA: YggS family pyridoxal phosphate-dependent enzyme [Actinomycetes bacterium]|nr:YggS family pyridoxal phosphate-dependent enzyme [Actinomycetes bacterium]
MTPDDRRAEIAANLGRVEERIGAACRGTGRSRAEITLVAVTKTFPASDVGHLAALGVRDVGENRAADGAEKAATCAAAGVTGVSWHFVGQLQTNKAAQVAAYADVVHSVDRARLVGALDRSAGEVGRRLACLVQVDLSGEPGRGGADPADVGPLADAVATAEHLDLRGVMAVAPLGADPAEAFTRLADVAADLRTRHPGAVVVSAGMSGDLEAAIDHGATHLRVGTALLGSRPSLR